MVRLAVVNLYWHRGRCSVPHYHRPPAVFCPSGITRREAQTAVLTVKHRHLLPFNREDIRNEDGAAMVEGDLMAYSIEMVEDLFANR